MRLIHAIEARIDDRINPVVVKELRQAVRGRLIPIALILYLAVLLVFLGVVATAGGSDPGERLVMMYFGTFAFVGIFLIPASLGRRLASERSIEDMDLLFITTLPPARIVAGKLIAGMVLSFVFLSATLPFMATAYLFRGVDLIVSLELAFLALVFSATTLQISLLMGVLPVPKNIKTLISIGFLLGLFFLFFMVIAVFDAALKGRIPWDERGVMLGILLAISIVAYRLCVALITPVTANRALPVRIWMTVIWALTGAGCLLLSDADDALEIWSVIWTLLFSISMFVAISERDEPGRRVLRAVPRNRLMRLVGFPFFSGAASGLTWTIGLMVPTAALMILLEDDPDTRAAQLISLLFTAGYTGTGHWVKRRFYPGVPDRFTWLVSLLLMGVAAVTPWVFHAFTRASWLAYVHVLDPFYLKPTMIGTYLISSMGLAVLALVLELPWYFSRVRGFKPCHGERGAEP